MTVQGPRPVTANPLGDPLSRELGAIRDSLAELSALATRARRPDLSEGVSEELVRLESSDPAVVVVCGETKRGKSSVVNSLVGHPDLLPVDTDISTGIPTVLRYGQEERAVVLFVDNDEPQSVSVPTAKSYISVATNPENAARVAHVELFLDVPMLDSGLTLVDTPGVGGLDAAHGRVTLAALTSADALLFIVDGAAPISDPELKFLRHAADRVEVVRILLTKTDMHPEWRTVLEEDRRLIGSYAPRFADVVVPVSAHLADRLSGAIPSGSALADTLREKAGLEAVRMWLTDEVAGRRRRLRLANAARVGLAVAAVLDELCDNVAGSLVADDGPELRLREEERKAQESIKSDAAWRAGVGEAFVRLDRTMQSLLAETLADVRQRFETEIAKRWRTGRQYEIGKDLQASLQAVETDIQAVFSQKLVAVLGTVTEGGGDLNSATLVGVAQGIEPTVLPLGPLDRQSIIRLARTALLGSSGGGTLRLTLSVLGLGPLGMALPILSSLLGVSLDLGNYHRAREQKEAQRQVSEILGTWQRGMTGTLAEAVREARREVEGIVAATLEGRGAQARSDLADLRSQSASQTQTRQRIEQLAATRSAIASAVAQLTKVASALVPKPVESLLSAAAQTEPAGTGSPTSNGREPDGETARQSGERSINV